MPREAPPWPIMAHRWLEEWRDDPAENMMFERNFASWLLSGEATPDDWHRYAMGANWDKGCDAMHWIIQQPQCDRATALRVFWAALPVEFLHYRGDRAAAWAEDWDPEAFDLVLDIGERWQAGFYRRSELAFVFGTNMAEDDFATDADFTALASQYGAFLDAWIPPSTRTSLTGRRLDWEGLDEGIPIRFMPAKLR